MTQLTFNINASVKVMLTGFGEQVWRKNFEENSYPDQKYTFEEHLKAHTKEDGMVEMQMHVLMNIFGEETFMGNQNCFFGNNIFFDDDQFKK